MINSPIFPSEEEIDRNIWNYKSNLPFDLALPYLKMHPRFNKFMRYEVYYKDKKMKIKIRNETKKIRAKLLEKFKECVLCGSKEKLELHHITYSGKEKHCSLLCQKCHRLIHKSTFVNAKW